MATREAAAATTAVNTHLKGRVLKDGELRAHLEAVKAGKLKVTPRQLGHLPEVGSQVICPVEGGEVVVQVVTAACLKAAEDIAFLMGVLDATDNENAPLPYSTTLCAEACGLTHPMQASRVLDKLERLRVIVHVGDMDKLAPHLDGTKLYAAGPGLPDRKGLRAIDGGSK